MFQTGPIHFLQSFASEWLTTLMKLVSETGYSSFHIPFLMIIALGVSFRKGLILMQMMMLVGLLVDLLKDVIGLPRPSDVDSTIKMLRDGTPNRAPFTEKGGTGFFSLPAAEAISLYRAQTEWSFGLPSGHVAGATTLWGGLSMLFRHKLVWAISLVMIVLMPLSRMYLGRHFIADVLGGLLLGGACVLVFRQLFIVPGNHYRLLNLTRFHLAYNYQSVLLVGYLLIAPLLFLPLIPMVDADDVGRFFGLNAALLLIGLIGLPDNKDALWKRVARVLLGFVAYTVVTMIADQVIDAFSLNEDAIWVEFLSNAITIFVAFASVILFCFRIGLYEYSSDVDTDTH